MRHGQSPAVSDRRRFGKRSESRPPGDSRSGLRRKRALVLSSKRTSTRSDRLFILPQAPARPCLWGLHLEGVVVERGTLTEATFTRGGRVPAVGASAEPCLGAQGSSQKGGGPCRLFRAAPRRSGSSVLVPPRATQGP